MTRSKKVSLTAGLSLVILAACGGGVGGGDAALQFGQSFAQAFRANDRAEPIEPGVIAYRNVTGDNVAALAMLEPVNF